MKADLQALARQAEFEWRRFFAWWQAELLELFHSMAVRLLPRIAAVTRVDASTESLGRIFEGALQRPSTLDRVRRLEILLPPEAILSRSVQLPAAATLKVRDALELQYARLMPLRRQDVLLDHQLANTASQTGMIAVTVAALKRTTADRVAALARAWGAGKTTIVVSGAGLMFRFPVTLLESSAAPTSRVIKALQFATVVLAAGLVLVALFGWWPHERVVNAELEFIRANARVAANMAADLQSRRQVALLLDQALPTFDFLKVTAELTRILPDTAWAFQMSQKGHRIQLLGEANRSSALALQLEESPLFQNVRLQSTTGVSGEGSGRFDLTLDFQYGSSP